MRTGDPARRMGNREAHGMNFGTGLLEQRTLALALLAVAILSGLTVPSVTLALQPYAMDALLWVVVLSLVPFARMQIIHLIAAEKSVWRLVLWQQVFLPCLVVAIGLLADFPETIVELMIVSACAGSLFASPMLAELLGLDRRHAVQCMVVSTIVMPASLWVCLSAFHGMNVPLNLADYAARVALFLGLPFAAFIVYGQVVTRIPSRASAVIETAARWGSVLALTVFGLGMMHSVGGLLADNPTKAIFLLSLAVCLNVGMFLLTVIVMYRYGLEIALTTGILSGFRNVGLGYALVGDALGSDLAAYIGLSMLPMFIAPMIIRIVILQQAASWVVPLAPASRRASTPA